MAISLKKYDRKVGFTGETGAKKIDSGLASQMIESAGARDTSIANALGNAAKVADAFIERNKEIKAKALKVEGDLLEHEFSSALDLANSVYSESRQNRTDYSTWGTGEDKGLVDWKDSTSKILSDPRLQKFPNLKAELEITISKGLQGNAVKARAEGVSIMGKMAKTANENTLERLYNMGDSDGALAQINKMRELELYNPVEMSEFESAHSSKLESNRLTKAMYNDTENTITILEAQRSGKSPEGAFALDDAAIKSGLTQANKILSDKQNLAASETYLSEEYVNSSDEDKIVKVRELEANGTISTAKAVSEIRRIQEDPKISPDEIATLGKARADIRLAAAGRHPEGKTVAQLVAYYGTEDRSQDFMTRLTGYSLAEVNPDEAVSGRAYKSVREEYAQRLAEMAADGSLIEPGKGFLWFESDTAKQFQGMNTDQRESASSVLNQGAITEFNDRMDDWKIKNADSSIQETREEAQEIFSEVAKEFAQSEVPSLIEEYNLLETVETQYGDRRGRTNKPRVSRETVDANESNVVKVMEKLNISREEAIQKLKDANRWN
jgi:hypothetical protein